MSVIADKGKNAKEVGKQKKKSGLKAILLGIVFLILIIIAGVGILFALPTKTVEEIKLDEKNSNIYSALVAEGISEAFVDATEERVRVIYDLPSSLDKEASWYYVMGVVASISPESKRVIIQASVNGKSGEEVAAQIKDVVDFVDARITEGTFKSKLAIK